MLHKRIRDSYLHPQFMSDVIKPLQIEPLFDNEVPNLSGGGWVLLRVHLLHMELLSAVGWLL